MDDILIGDTLIGSTHPSYIVAEIGINHNGDIGLAKETIDAAVETNVNAIKFQNYKTEDFITSKTCIRYLSKKDKWPYT